MSTLFRSPLIVLDTETTGLLTDPQATPWEIAAVALDERGQEVGTISLVGRPDPWREDMRRIVALPWMGRFGDWKMPKLSEAASFYAVPQQEPAHRALADARTAGLIAIEIQRRALAARTTTRTTTRKDTP